VVVLVFKAQSEILGAQAVVVVAQWGLQRAVLEQQDKVLLVAMANPLLLITAVVVAVLVELVLYKTVEQHKHQQYLVLQ
jgi:hypothetical protein